MEQREAQLVERERLADMRDSLRRSEAQLQQEEIEVAEEVAEQKQALAS